MFSECLHYHLHASSQNKQLVSMDIDLYPCLAFVATKKVDNPYLPVEVLPVMVVEASPVMSITHNRNIDEHVCNIVKGLKRILRHINRTAATDTFD